MKSNIVIFWSLAIYCWVLAVVYSVWNYIDHESIEWVGSTALVLSGALAAMIAFYLGLVVKNQGGVLHEDLEEADIDEGDPEIGHFAPWSWWPIVFAFGGSAVVFGFALNGNFFVIFFSIPILVVGAIGWVYEHYRGLHAR